MARRASTIAAGERPARKRSPQTRKAQSVKTAATKTRKQAERAGGAKGTGKRGMPARSNRQQLIRDSAVMAQLAVGHTPKVVGEMFGISDRAVRACRTRFQERQSAVEERPFALVEWLLKTQQQLIADFETLSFAFVDESPASAVAAKRAAQEAIRDFAQLLDNLGKLPDNLELFRSEAQMRALAERMLAKLKEFEAGKCTAEEVGAVFREAVTSPRRPFDFESSAEEGARELPAG